MKPPIVSKAEQTRHFIIRKVAPIFNKKGYAGTSLSDLTRATGLTKGSIYGNFRNKDEVAVCAFEHNVALIRSAFAEELAGAASSFEKLLGYPRVYRSLYKKLLDSGGCPILNTAVEADDTHKQLHQLAVAAIAEWKNGMMRLIEKGKKEGDIDPRTEADRTARVVIALLEGGALLTKATGEESYVLHAIEQIETLLVSIRRRS